MRVKACEACEGDEAEVAAGECVHFAIVGQVLWPVISAECGDECDANKDLDDRVSFRHLPLR